MNKFYNYGRNINYNMPLNYINLQNKGINQTNNKSGTQSVNFNFVNYNQNINNISNLSGNEFLCDFLKNNNKLNNKKN